MTIYLAIDADAAQGLALPNGVIRGISDSAQGLVDAGFAAATYTGQRAPTIEHDAAGWDNDAQPGWFWIGGAVSVTRPASDLEALKTELRELWAWFVAMDAEATRVGAGFSGQAGRRVHDLLWRARGGSYLTARDTAQNLDARKEWATAMRRGPTDGESAMKMFAAVPSQAPTGWIVWADPATAARRTMAAAATAGNLVTGDPPDTVDLTDAAWIEGIAA